MIVMKSRKSFLILTRININRPTIGQRPRSKTGITWIDPYSGMKCGPQRQQPIHIRMMEEEKSVESFS